MCRHSVCLLQEDNACKIALFLASHSFIAFIKDFPSNFTVGEGITGGMRMVKLALLM